MKKYNASILLVNKPFNMLCQFSDDKGRATLADIIPKGEYKDYYPAGRLDRDSEGLVILTNNGLLQNTIAHPEKKMAKTYWVQVEGDITQLAIESLSKGVVLKDGLTKPAQAAKIAHPDIWERIPPIRERKNIPTSWISLTISEGKNRQVRRMTAAVGFPTLRLVRAQIGDWHLASLKPGEITFLDIDFLYEKTNRTASKDKRHHKTVRTSFQKTRNKKHQ